MPPAIPQNDLRALVQEKYEGDASRLTKEDYVRLASGEPLAYIIGWVPFLSLRINLDSRPLIPRPETEWWTEALRAHIKDRPLSVLDLCAGSGAVGLALLKHCTNAKVSFGEIREDHGKLIRENMRVNHLRKGRIATGDLFAPFPKERFDIIAVNPPYVPKGRTLPESVVKFEPREALFSGSDGLALIRRILRETREHLHPHGELWMECDTKTIEEVATLIDTRAEIRTDQYGRPRLLVGYYP